MKKTYSHMGVKYWVAFKAGENQGGIKKCKANDSVCQILQSTTLYVYFTKEEALEFRNATELEQCKEILKTVIRRIALRTTVRELPN